ncbi:phosphotransferase family protein [Mycolicibacterium sp. HK-90]|uniref:phosphotransferase family protein n=1 Tax=Mycolicibacterium sp. HK-90 TaxID=3056937 RepID=UPI0026596C67|nr:phosphotransferase family protein [Mycolicibacterium sp. HK-90]WKG04028.1 phosphotransferase family protein [Mycolicibacterium sp. HK-90]
MTDPSHSRLEPDAVTGALPVRAEDAFDVEAMAAWLRDNATPGATDADLSAVPHVEQFNGGASNLTYLLRYPGADLILRRPPKGSHHGSAHDMGREYLVQNQVGQSLPHVPRTVALCEDSSVIGTPFYVMERIDGLIVRKNLPAGVALTREQTEVLCRNAVDLLIELHRVDLDATKLTSLDKGDGYVRRQVEGWSKRYRTARTWNVGRFEKVMRWLAANQPADHAHSLVHNDFRFDNLVLDRNDPTRPIGLLDWELATVGDPLMDLANSLGYWLQADDAKYMQLFRRQPTNLPGMMTRAQVVAYYCQQTGTDITHRQWIWYEVFGLFRIAVIAQQVYQRYLTKQTTNKQFRFFGIAVLLLEWRCRRLIASATHLPTDRANDQIGSIR